MTRRPLAVVLAAVAVLALAGCAEPASDAAPAATASATASASATPTAAALSGTIVVDAAASLSGVLPPIATAFEQAHPGTTVRLTFGGSSALAAQIVAGAPVDVFAAASTKTMQTVSDAGLAAAGPVVIARNELEIAVPPSNPGKVTGLADFADGARTIVVCDAKVPCGAAAQRVFALAKVAAKPDSYEPDVTSVLNKVELGEADAGLVYRTDVLAAGGRVKGIPFPEAAKAITAYPIAPLKGSAHSALAAAFVDEVVQHGAARLRAAGFLGP
ncbi:molybdate ABC transporter substrate-binding protein [Amnibacterium sp. CER49]|uniref:molybdate ABC transporter substrate-binding protein n=1 Tax=Amnibacterium sp. CER49 TaxID=3039161 RepID=UPI002446BBCD|nr:molybdate ABC transporter substrate-binding protein [Amnibacterium sp. CER49]MDH2442863.1 molybdate ABC transporter substrate-binding protein [Amnibacterium sp. CER49]